MQHLKSIIQHSFLSIIVTAICGTYSHAQKLTRELQVENDNDAYTLNFSRDQYYSNGVVLRYRSLRDSAKLKSSMEKSIRAYAINHRIYTTKHLFWTDSSQMDRPYAGQISLSATQEYYFKNNSYIYAELELGWMGPALRMGDLQYHWHKTFGMQLPFGWDYEVNNAPIVNIYGKYARTLKELDGIDIGIESNISAGTAFAFARQELIFRIGNFKPIHLSTQYNGSLGRDKSVRKQHEAYFFISPGVEYVGFNSTIEGSWAGPESIFTKPITNWVYQTRAGFLMSWTQFDFALFYYRRSKETPEATFHKYIGIRMSQRF